ncbi:hypothetical protein DMC63_01360 [Streptomyces sp. WAC 05977]|nr:hypothetical protein DMC63_01360 [Streptomyces sp. WAC 05977]
MDTVKLPTLSPRTWRLLAGAAIAVLVMFGLRAWLGATDWAGLGQWIGGLGAFAAAVVALRVAGDESRREAEREAEKRFINAHYVSASWVVVEVDGERQQLLEIRNKGIEPVRHVDAVAVHLKNHTVSVVRLEMSLGPQNVLLPNEPWHPPWKTNPANFGTTAAARFLGPGGDVEITFEDLGGQRWRRIGTQPPTKDETV